MPKKKIEKSKICFIIATQGHGRGGHFWDLKTIVEALREHMECTVINIGPCSSPVIDSIPVTVHNISFNGLNIVSAISQCIAIINDDGIEVLNLFDTRIYCILDIASRITRCPLVLTKCGGPNPGRFYPVTDNLIVFSEENQVYFLSHPNYAKSQICFLPNRVARPASDPVRIEKLLARLDPRKKTFLMISRFCEHYKKNMVQAVNLIQHLNAEGKECQLLIVGTPEVPRVVDEIRLYCDDGVIMVNEDEFTMEASELIDVADFVIAAGRGFMEAASRGKPLLTALSDSRFPVLITEETFPSAFATNFSPRNRIKDLDQEKNYVMIARMLENSDFCVELSALSLELFKKHFDVNAVVEDYKVLFSSVSYRKRYHFVELLHGVYSILRSFAPFWWPFRSLD